MNVAISVYYSRSHKFLKNDNVMFQARKHIFWRSNYVRASPTFRYTRYRYKKFKKVDIELFAMTFGHA